MCNKKLLGVSVLHVHCVRKQPIPLTQFLDGDPINAFLNARLALVAP